MPSCFSTRMLGLNALGSLIPNPEKKEACAPPDHLPALSCARMQVPNQAVLQVLCLHLFIVDTLLGAKNKGIRDAGSTADFRILFEILKFENLKI